MTDFAIHTQLNFSDLMYIKDILMEMLTGGKFSDYEQVKHIITIIEKLESLAIEFEKENGEQQ